MGTKFMEGNATTLYKLMILYMLSKVNFPLTNSQMSTFMLEKQYTDYFTFQETINSLVADSFIKRSNYQNNTQYQLTKDGVDTIAFFYTKISSSIREEIDEYLITNKYNLKNESGTTSDYYRTTDGTYMTDCKVKEGNINIIELSLNVPLEEQAETICAKWRENSQEIYEFIINKLM